MRSLEGHKCVTTVPHQAATRPVVWPGGGVPSVPVGPEAEICSAGSLERASSRSNGPREPNENIQQRSMSGFLMRLA